MITTPDLIESLVAKADPVHPLRTPLARSTGWVLFAALMLALIVISHGVRPDLGLHLRQPMFAIGTSASFLTGALAAVAAFTGAVPGRSRFWLLLPVPALVLWMSTVGYGCFSDWVSLGDRSVGDETGCFAALLLIGTPLSLSMLIMLRHAAFLGPMPVAICAGLAVAGITATMLSLFHNHDASVLTLLWSVGTVVLFVALGGLFGSRMLARAAPR